MTDARQSALSSAAISPSSSTGSSSMQSVASSQTSVNSATASHTSKRTSLDLSLSPRSRSRRPLSMDGAGDLDPVDSIFSRSTPSSPVTTSDGRTFTVHPDSGRLSARNSLDLARDPRLDWRKDEDAQSSSSVDSAGSGGSSQGSERSGRVSVVMPTKAPTFPCKLAVAAFILSHRLMQAPETQSCRAILLPMAARSQSAIQIRLNTWSSALYPALHWNM